MKVVVAIDSLKGCLTSQEANGAAADGVLCICPDAEVVQVPVSDGGEGFMEAFHAAIGGAKQIIVGLGGSATSDAGMGMLRALVDAWAKQGSFDDIKELSDIRFTIASDVKNPLCGEHGAAHVFAPQKGATPDMVLQLDERARKFADISAKHFGYDCSEQEGAGAAGGLGYAFLQYLHADCRPGIELLLDTIHFNDIVKDADLVITGEGSADRQTLMGKLPMGILNHAGTVPVCLIAGRISDREQLLQAGFAQVECINPSGITLEEAMRPEVAKQHIRNTVEAITRKTAPPDAASPSS